MRREVQEEPDLDELAHLWQRETGDDTSDSAAPGTRLDVQLVADAITAGTHFARNPGGRLHVYCDGVYRRDGESFIRERVKAIYREAGQGGRWSLHRSNEAVEYIRVDCPVLWEAPPHHTINVLNGLVDVSNRQIRPHSPEFLSSIQIPVRFDPDANCPAWDKFIASVFPADAQAIAWELLGWLLTAENSIQKAILLLGEGSNGKSTFLRGAVNFIGKPNTAALSLHKIEQDRFAAARLVGKLANICPDLPTAHLSSTTIFKALTGGDVLSAEYKFKDVFEYIPFCKLVFSANQPPASDDNTHGFFRRWQVIPFTRCFEEGSPDTLTREEIDAELSRPEELSGVLNRALDGITRIRERGFTQSDSMNRAWNEFRTATDPLIVWLDQNTTEVPDAQILQSDLLQAFNKHMVDFGKQPMTKTAFGLALKRARPNIESCQRTHMEKPRQWVYRGIAIREERMPGE